MTHWKMKNVIFTRPNFNYINVNLIGRFMVILRIVSSKLNCNISFNVARIPSCYISKFKLGLSEFGETYLNETACPVLTV